MSTNLDFVKKFFLLSGKIITYATAFLIASVAGNFAITIIVIATTKGLSYPINIFSILRHYDHDLIIGISSIFASVVVIYAAYLNIKNLRYLAKREDNRRLEVALSTLPFALFELSELCTRLARGIAKKINHEVVENDILSENSMQSIRSIIEYYNGEDIEEFYKIPIYYQICIAKFEQRMKNRATKRSEIGAITNVDWHYDKLAIIHIISLKCIAKCYLNYLSHGIIKFDIDLTREYFDDEIYNFNEGNLDDHGHCIDVEREFKKMLTGCNNGFINPNYFSNTNL